MAAHIPDKFVKAVTGRTIKRVVKVDTGDDEWLGLCLDDGSMLVVMRDPEGNGGGYISVEKDGKSITGAGRA